MIRLLNSPGSPPNALLHCPSSLIFKGALWSRKYGIVCLKKSPYITTCSPFYRELRWILSCDRDWNAWSIRLREVSPRCTFPIAAINNVENSYSFFTEKWKNALNFSIPTIGSFGGGHFRNKTRLATTFVIKTWDICAYQQETNQ